MKLSFRTGLLSSAKGAQRTHLKMVAWSASLGSALALSVLLFNAWQAKEAKANNFQDNGKNNNQNDDTPLLLFTATVDEHGVILDWETAKENQALHYKLYRSTDGVIYDELAKQSGHGTSPYQHRYHYKDVTAPIGRVYYRLAQSAYDGTMHVFDPIAVRNIPGRERTRICDEFISHSLDSVTNFLTCSHTRP